MGEHCMSIWDQLTCNAIVGILEAAVILRHDSFAFWSASLGHCGRSISQGSSWESRYIALLSLLVANMMKIPPAAPGAVESWPPVPDDVVHELFEGIAAGSQEIMQKFEL